MIVIDLAYFAKIVTTCCCGVTKYSMYGDISSNVHLVFVRNSIFRRSFKFNERFNSFNARTQGGWASLSIIPMPFK